MTKFTQSLHEVGILTIALTLALVANFAYGQWADPSAAPTAGNVSAPINTGSVAQLKMAPLEVSNASVVTATSPVNPAFYLNDATTNVDARIVLDNAMKFQAGQYPSGPWSDVLILTTNSMKSNVDVHATQYCDSTGNKCFSAQDIENLMNAAAVPPAPAPQTCTNEYQTFSECKSIGSSTSCPSGWIPLGSFNRGGSCGRDSQTVRISCFRLVCS